MSRTNLEFSFQVTGPIGDRAVGAAPRGDELRPAFSDHLSQASATSLSDPEKSVQSDDNNHGRATDRRRASTPASNGNDSPPTTEASRDDTEPLARATHERDDVVADESRRAEETSRAGADGPVASGEVSDGEDRNRESENDNTENHSLVTAVAIDGQPNQRAAFGEAEEATIDKRSASAVVTESSDDNAGANRHAAQLVVEDVPTTDVLDPGIETANPIEASAELVDQSAGTKDGRKSRKAKADAPAEDGAGGDHTADAGNRGAVTEEIGGAAAVDTAKATNEPSQSETSSRTLGQSDEVDSRSEDQNRDSTARGAARSRGDAEVVANKTATAVVANVVVAQTRDGASNAETADGATQNAKSITGKNDGNMEALLRLHANYSSAKRTGRTKEADDTPRVDPARFVGRVAKAFHTAQERGGTLHLRLSPPELGSLRLELTVKDGVMMAALETETASARRVLLDHLPALRDRLAEQNIRVERFDVDVRRDGSGGQADPRASQDQQQQQPQQGHPQRRQSNLPQRDTSTQRQVTPAASPLINNSGINLVA